MPVSTAKFPLETPTDAERQQIEAQLERLLSNPFFNQSRRFPPFLRYVVHETLSGHANHLKERNLGIEVFGKGPDYDTSNDPIVRVTAAEIRKRIAQYYQDPVHDGELRMSIPPGSYVPQFHFPALDLPATEPHPAVEVVTITAEPVVLESNSAARPKRISTTTVFTLASVALLLVCLSGFAWWRHHQQTSAFAEFWSPILTSSDPILFCIADQTQYTALSLRDAADPTRQLTLKDNLTAVVIDDVNTVAKIAGVLQSADKHYTILGEGKTNLADLRNGPAIIIGAFDNAWALRLLTPLRYHFANAYDMSTFSVVDGQHPAGHQWLVSRSQQIATNNYRDYAIVARFNDATTGVPTLIAAGIGRGGTIAAGEFLVNPEMLQEVRNKRPSSTQKNVEVVLSTQIIDGEPASPTIEAVHYW